MKNPTAKDRALAARLRRARLQQRRKLIEVAACIGITENRLVHYEQVKRRPPRWIIAAWERTLSEARDA